jgi:hypothetical protein
MKYIEIIKVISWNIGKINIKVDFGQEVKTLFNQEQKLRLNGKVIEMNSIVEALNLMDSYRFELYQVYVENSQNESTSHFLLKKKEKILLQN